MISALFPRVTTITQWEIWAVESVGNALEVLRRGMRPHNVREAEKATSAKEVPV